MAVCKRCGIKKDCSQFEEVRKCPNGYPVRHRLCVPCKAAFDKAKAENIKASIRPLPDWLNDFQMLNQWLLFSSDLNFLHVKEKYTRFKNGS